MIKGLLKSFIFEILFLLITTITLALLIFFDVVDDKLINNITFFVSIINALLLSFIIAINIRKKGIIIGVVIGALFLIISLIISKIINENINYLKGAILLTSSLLGGVFGVNIKKNTTT